MSYTRRPNTGKRLVAVYDLEDNLVMNFASYDDLRDKLGFENKHIKHVTCVISGDRNSVNGYKLRNIGLLLEGA